VASGDDIMLAYKMHHKKIPVTEKINVEVSKNSFPFYRLIYGVLGLFFIS
jgi:hypothetical protein